MWLQLSVCPAGRSTGKHSPLQLPCSDVLYSAARPSMHAAHGLLPWLSGAAMLCISQLSAERRPAAVSLCASSLGCRCRTESQRGSQMIVTPAGEGSEA